MRENDDEREKSKRKREREAVKPFKLSSFPLIFVSVKPVETLFGPKCDLILKITVEDILFQKKFLKEKFDSYFFHYNVSSPFVCNLKDLKIQGKGLIR